LWETFLELQVSILVWFMKDHVTWRTGVMMLKIQIFIKGINQIFTIENIEFKFKKYWTLLLYYIVCGICEYEWLFFKNVTKNYTNPKLVNVAYEKFTMNNYCHNTFLMILIVILEFWRLVKVVFDHAEVVAIMLNNILIHWFI